MLLIKIQQMLQSSLHSQKGYEPHDLQHKLYAFIPLKQLHLWTKGARKSSIIAVPQYTSCCCSIQLLEALQWQWQTLTSPIVLCIPPCSFCSRQNSQFRVSSPLAFQQMQKMPSSQASRQASAECTPRRGALKEVLSEKRMNFTFCIIA